MIGGKMERRERRIFKANLNTGEKGEENGNRRGS